MALHRAFRYAGTRSVLMSLCEAENVSTTILTEHFFKHIKNGKDKLAVLIKARTELRLLSYEHPFYWAPFILVGEY